MIIYNGTLTSLLTAPDRAVIAVDLGFARSDNKSYIAPAAYAELGIASFGKL